MLVDTKLKQMVENVLLPACDNDLDDDGDGLYDTVDPGCAASTDTSERSAALPCDDGADNDGDGSADHDPATLADPSAGDGDPGCKSPHSAKEDPKCQNGLDDDGAPGTDFDAGVSILGPGGADPNGPDPQCLSKPWRNKEAPDSCGLGAELVLLLAARPGLRRRVRRAARSPGRCRTCQFASYRTHEDTACSLIPPDTELRCRPLPSAAAGRNSIEMSGSSKEAAR